MRSQNRPLECTHWMCTHHSCSNLLTLSVSPWCSLWSTCGEHALKHTGKWFYSLINENYYPVVAHRRHSNHDERERQLKYALFTWNWSVRKWNKHIYRHFGAARIITWILSIESLWYFGYLHALHLCIWIDSVHNRQSFIQNLVVTIFSWTTIHVLADTKQAN